jgi:drug/metabolite transporter (DMT)-like permease
MPARTRAYIYILIAIIIWAIAGPVIKYSLNYLDTITFLTIRFGLTSIILVPFWLWTERHKRHLFPPLSGVDWILLIISGLMATTIQLTLLFFGFERTTAIEGTLISSVAPIFIALAGHRFLKDHITKREQIGMTIALVGTLIVVGLPSSITNLWGNILVLLANAAWVAEAILTKKLLRHNLSPLFLTMFSFLMGFISMTPIYFIIHNSSFNIQISTNGWFGLIYMTIFSGIIAYWLFFKGQKTIEASEANVFMYLQPLIATPIGFFWLHEAITWNFLFGGLVIALGVCLAMRRS